MSTPSRSSGPRAHFRAVAALLAALLLPGCFSGLHSKAAPPQRYVLQPPAAASAPRARPAGTAAPSLLVLTPVAAPGLAGDAIAVLRPGARLDAYANARWAGDAPAAVQSLVVRTLRDTGRFAVVEGEEGPFAAQYLLSLDLTHFEARYEGPGPPTVSVEIIAGLGRRSDRLPLLSFTARSEVTADADRMQAVIAAFERATQDVLQQIAASVSLPETH